jgi:predicted ATPase/class 3 adenylate cyclase
VEGMPTGTITFLFTDIEGSTRLWEEQTAPMKGDLARHDEILRRCIEGNGGNVFKTIGDAFCGAFSTAFDGLRAALDAQLALLAEKWKVLDGIRVRMALHTGTAEERDGDYFGPTLNRVARLLSIGYGGQTLVSLVTAELVRDILPEKASLKDLGAHRLKDLLRPESVFQVLYPGQPEDFPALKSLDNHPNNLAAQPTPFIGREKELEKARKALLGDACRVVTFTGVGGAGKTRLGLQTAANLTDDFPDGVYFVDLSAIDSPSFVIPAVARTLDIQRSADRPFLELVKNALKDKRMLLLLDNFEQVMGAVPNVVELLSACPFLKLIVTSREALHVRMENVLPVPPLSAPKIRTAREMTATGLGIYDSVSLFIERALAVRPDFSVTNENAPAVAEICARLDGLPLAIELAAARITMLTPRAILERLGSRLKLLTGGPSDLPYRQRTLRATIDWSYRTLSPAEQNTFREVSVFAGGATIESVVKLCGCDLETTDITAALGSLVDKSLIWRDDGPGGHSRFQMFETIREYGMELLANAGQGKAMRDAHAGHFLEIAESTEPMLRGPEQKEVFDGLESDHDNFQAAIDWLHEAGSSEKEARLCAALTGLYQVRGYLVEGRANLERCLTRSADFPPSVRARLFLGLARIANSQDRYAESLKLLDSSAADYTRAGDAAGLVSVDCERGWSCHRLGRQDRAIAYYQAVLERSPAEDQYTRALAELGIGSSKCMTGDLDDAEKYLARSRKVFTQLGDDRSLARTLLSILMLSYQKGDFAAALQHCQEALTVQERLNDLNAQVIVFNNLGSLNVHLGKFEEAKAWYEKLLSRCERIANRHFLAWGHTGLAESYLGLGDDALALEHSRKAIAIAEELDAPFDLGVSTRVLGEVHLRQGRIEDALDALLRSLPLVEKGGDAVEYRRTQQSIEKARAQMPGSPSRAPGRATRT